MSLNQEEKKALELLNDAVDGLLSAEDQIFFETYCTQNLALNKLFKELCSVKNVLAYHADTHVKLTPSKKEILFKRALEVAKSDIQVTELVTTKSWQNRWSTWLLTVAALITLSWVGSIYVQGSFTTEDSFEHFVSSSFVSHEGGYIKPTWEIQQNSEAEAAIESVFSYKVHVPIIKGAKFMGIVDVTDEMGNHVPMLEYCQEEIDEYIYLFAFDMSQPNQPVNKRLREAIFNCRSQTDYHISELAGKHVVSWKWDNTWYSAVSNHNGNDLAALVGPLNP